MFYEILGFLLGSLGRKGGFMNTEIIEGCLGEVGGAAGCADGNIKVSVVMPIYNAYAYLRPALDSVLDQSLRELELICVDDGSDDGSVEIIEEYKSRDSRIRVVKQENGGPAKARNSGLAIARGEYVAFLDADDFFELDLLEKLYGIAVRDDLDIAIAKYDIYNSKKARFRANAEAPESEIYEVGGVTSKNEHPEKILQSASGFAWDKLFRRSFLLEKKISFLEDVKMFEDVYFTVCALAFAERVGKVQCVLVHHRIHSEQTRAKVYKKFLSQVPLVYVKIKEFLMKGGMYQPLHTGFFRLSVSRCYYVFNLIASDAKDDFWNLIHNEYAEALDWQERDIECITDDNQQSFLSHILLYDYREYKKRLSRGASRPRKDRMKTYIVRHKKREKFKAFLSRLFGRKVKDGAEK